MSTDILQDQPMDAPDDGGEDTTQWVGLDEGLAEVVTNKGWKAPADAVKGYQEAEKRLREIQSERDRLLEAFQTAEDYGQQQPVQQPAQQPGGDIESMVGNLAAAIDNGSVDAGQGIMFALSQIVPQMVEQKLQEHTTPLRNQLTSRDMRDQATSLRNQFQEAGLGDVFQEVAQEAAKLARPGSMYDSADGMEAALGAAFLRRHLQESKARATRERSATVDQGARAQLDNTSASEAWKKALMEYE